MGYRSDVKYVICLPDETAFTKYMAEVNLMLADKPDMKGILDKFTNSVQKEPTEVGYKPKYEYRICVHWEYIKWYEGYDEVTVQEELMALATEYDGAWFFARMGENDDDYETKYDGMSDDYVEDYIELQRQTVFI